MTELRINTLIRFCTFLSPATERSHNALVGTLMVDAEIHSDTIITGAVMENNYRKFTGVLD